ncbi:unnamed protein product [Closterium sp. NIES-54]
MAFFIAAAVNPKPLTELIKPRYQDLVFILPYPLLCDALWQAESKRVSREKYVLNKKLSRADANWEALFLSNQSMHEAQMTVQRCNGHGIVAQQGTLVWKGYTCDAADEALRQYTTYDASGACPDDWFATQSLIFHHRCFSLPQRRCRARTTNQTIDPLPFPQALFNLSALIDTALVWDHHACSSFACLNARVVGDCRLCFNLTLERNRWRVRYRGSLTIADVLKMKQGSIRLGLDIGGGTGSFAAHMALYNVTILTTAMNVETVVGRKQGLPYMEAIALRGLIPLHLPHKARLPFFDGSLDIIHSVNSVKYLPMLEFEEMLFEWDRVLRVGGVIWLEMFYAPLDEFPVYVAILNLLSYIRLHWRVLPKPDPGERKGPHVYLNCLLEKPVRREEGWGGAGRRREEGGGEEGRRGEFGGGEEGRRREEAGGEEGRRGAAGGRREEVGGEDGVGREGVKREEGRRKEEGRGEETSSRAEGEVKGGRRSEEARQLEGSRKEGGEEEGKREEWNEAEREPEKSEGAQVELKSREGSEREEGRREEAWIEEWGQQEGTSIEQFAREWYREEGGSGEVGVSREGERRTAEEKAERQRLSARVQERRDRKAWWRLFGSCSCVVSSEQLVLKAPVSQGSSVLGKPIRMLEASARILLWSLLSLIGMMASLI